MKLFTAAPFVLLFVVFCLSGCASKPSSYNLKVRAVVNPTKPIGESYVLVPNVSGTDIGELRYKELIEYVKTALSSKGLWEANSAEDASMIVIVDFGMKPMRQEIRLTREPVFKDHPVLLGPRGTIPIDKDIESESDKRVRESGGIPIANGVVGYRIKKNVVAVREKYLKLVAIENLSKKARGGAPIQELWSVTVWNDNESKNLREYLPVLAAALGDYVGWDTSGNIENLQLEEDDDGVIFIKDGMDQEHPMNFAKELVSVGN